MSHFPDVPQDQLDEIREIFDHYDHNRNNKIEVGEFRNLLIALGGEVIEGEVEAGLDALDTNRNGTIDWSEFIAWWARKL